MLLFASFDGVQLFTADVSARFTVQPQLLMLLVYRMQGTTCTHTRAHR